MSTTYQRHAGAGLSCRATPSVADGAVLFAAVPRRHFGRGYAWQRDRRPADGREPATPPGASRFDNEPDLFDALRQNLRLRANTRRSAARLRVDRAFVGSRTTGFTSRTSARYGDFGRVAFAWSVPLSSLPRRFALTTAARADGAGYILARRERRAAGRRAHRRRRVGGGRRSFACALVKVGRDGAEAARLEPAAVSTATYAHEETIVGLQGLAGHRRRRGERGEHRPKPPLPSRRHPDAERLHHSARAMKRGHGHARLYARRRRREVLPSIDARGPFVAAAVGLSDRRGAPAPPSQAPPASDLRGERPRGLRSDQRRSPAERGRSSRIPRRAARLGVFDTPWPSRASSPRRPPGFRGLPRRARLDHRRVRRGRQARGRWLSRSRPSSTFRFAGPVRRRAPATSTRRGDARRARSMLPRRRRSRRAPSAAPSAPSKLASSARAALRPGQHAGDQAARGVRPSTGDALCGGGAARPR